MIELSDNESLEKENISLDFKMKEFNDIYKKVIGIKNKIELEINNINAIFEKTIENLTKSYLKKHEQLIKEENSLKENLENKVTKTKEKLESFLSQINNGIKISERLNKGINKMKNEEKNIIKNISYISKINETQKKINTICQQLMKSIKFSFDEENNIIKYDEYYFNGIVKPKNITIKDITISSFNILWEIDNIKFINNNNNIKYQVEIRKENEIFKKAYEGNNKYCLIGNLNQNTDYEIRICSIYNDLIGEWTEIQKITTRIDSNILSKSNKEKEYLEKLKEWTGAKKFELQYRGTRDGMTHKEYHNKCDNLGKSIILIQNDKNNIFGGYASMSWKIEKCQYQNAPNSFLFSLSNSHNSEPIKFPCIDDNKALFYRSDFGPLFGMDGNDLGLYKDFIKEGGFSCTFPNTYSDTLGKGKSVFTGDSNNYAFKIKEIEVFLLM